MHSYRTHTCGQLLLTNVNSTVKLSGWVHRKRDHGNLLFIDLRDHYGITQLVFTENNPLLPQAAELKLESVVTITGKVIERTSDTINLNLPTGKIEVAVETINIESVCAPLPLQVNSDQDAGEDIRLKHRYLDLRREKSHKNIMLRSEVIECIRNEMQAMGFIEFQREYLLPVHLKVREIFLFQAGCMPANFTPCRKRRKYSSSW